MPRLSLLNSDESLSPLRILFVSHSFPPLDRPLTNVGGMQRVATELYDALKAHPEVELSAVVMRSSWKWTHIRTGPFLLDAFYRIRREIRSGQVDLVLFSSMVSATLAIPLRQTLAEHGVFAAAIVHGRDVMLDFAPYQQLVPRVFDALDLVLPVSSATGDACLMRGLSPDRLQVVPNGVSAGRFSERAERRRHALELRFRGTGVPVPEAGLLLCSVGRQVRRKGFTWFVDQVMPLLPDDVHYWLAGDGPESEQILAAAQRRGVDGRVRLLGRISEEDLELLYAGADLFVMPNIPVPGDMEGFGVVMLEAGLSGLPSVASRLEGITDVIRDGENGHLIDSGDAWAFSEAIMKYYHAPAELEEASARAARFVADNFTWRAVADQYVTVLAEAVTPPVPDESFA